MKELRDKIIKYKETFDIIYLAGLMMYFVYLFMTTTMFEYSPVLTVFKVLSVPVVLVVVMYRFVCLCFKRDEWGVGCLMVLLLIIAAVNFVIRHDRSFLVYSMMIVGAKDVSFRRIALVLGAIGAVIMVAAVTASQLGIIEDLVYNSRGGRHGHALGICYTTDCAAHVFFLVLAYLYIRRGKLHIVEYMVLAWLTLELFEFTRSRTSMICLVMILSATAFYQLVMSHAGEKLAGYLDKAVGVLCIAFIAACTAAAIGLTVKYSADSECFAKLPSTIIHRLSMGKQAFTDYGLTMFGSDIPQMGFGTTTEDPSWYFYLDSSYVFVLLCKGTVIFVTMLVIELICAVRCLKYDVYLLIIMAAAALQCSTEQHWTELMYNFFVLATFADLSVNGAFGIGRFRDGLKQRFARQGGRAEDIA